MSKKSNSTTLRNKCFNLNNFQRNDFVFNFNLLEHFKQLFLKKNVIVSCEYLNISSNFYFFSANVFFKTKQLKSYKNSSMPQKKASTDCVHKTIFKNLNKSNFLNGINVSFNIFVLNNSLNNEFLLFAFKKLKSYSSIIFPRRFGMFIDFIKLTCLFFYSRISLDSYIKIIADIFKFLRKKSHAKFFLFLKVVFELILSSFLNKKFQKKNSSIKGLKLIISGRLKGKAIASNFIIKSGRVPSQSINANVSYATATSFTQNYGALGLKMWSFRTF